MEPHDPRPVGEAGLRAGRQQPAGGRPLRRGAPPAAARRHRQPPLVRLVLRRGRRPVRASPPPCPAWCASSPSSAPRPCPRTPPSWSPSAGPTSTGSGWPSTTTCSRRCSTAASRRPPSPRSTSGARATQRHQARRASSTRSSTLRRLKYRPTGGFTVSSLADAHPAVTGAVLDHDRQPKLAYARPGRGVPAGDRGGRLAAGRRSRPAPPLALDVHVVSDRRDADRRRRGDGPAVVGRRPPRLAVAGRRRRPTAAPAPARCRSSCPTRPGALTLDLDLVGRRAVEPLTTPATYRAVNRQSSGRRDSRRRFLNLAFR